MDARVHSLEDDPLWYKDAVIYQLHVKSFFDSDDNGIGDFRGLITKLDYITALGVNAVWLMPFYPSPLRDDGYDISEYRAINPDYGTLADFRRFVAAAHERGIRVITELVINHTSDQHPWFQRARYAKPGSTARNYYVWSNNNQAYSGTRVIFLDTEKSNWTWDPVAGAYFWHRFYSHQPDLNFDNPNVLRAVLGVMRFWLDLGVDGLRLDAIPYLVEREGTSNENLPETHAVLRKFRASLDARYRNRFFLAEANQWPEDTQEYFGQGDECHMAFHFPLMPRMYMAIAQEDRFPIADILSQTPEIPPSCQWAIFLRNHDELTLEMVTDGERDYLWQTYATDRRARLNLGIRRRLAPLLDRDRRCIELMNSLLLTLPGTPVIYYGDEIGMGDNIHLGDRDGVRTPMQWSPDRNGGFSRADPERLVLPQITNQLYGFQSVNVEAQVRDPHSLLNWMRRVIAMRRRHRSFGRGNFRLLYPRNRKILAYLREYEGETILCVANLARSPQAVEIDLSSFTGRVPVEMLGGSAFPPIGQLAYLLTLPPCGFYAFLLCTAAETPAWHTPAPEPMPEYHTLVVRGALTEILAEHPRRLIETEVLPAYLNKRRWFSAKDERLKGAHLALVTPFSQGGRDLLIAEVEAVMSSARRDRYLLPLGIAWEDNNLPALPQQLALSRIRRGRRVGFLTDAIALEALPHSILAALRDSAVVPTHEGEIHFVPTERLAGVEPPRDGEVQCLTAEQSNSSVILGETAVLKFVRRVAGGVHPEAEMGRFLTAAGVSNIAPLLGEVVRVASDGTPHTLVIVQGFIRNQGDAWTWALDYLRRSLDDIVLPEAETENRRAALADFDTFAAAIGRRLGEVHAALASPSEDPAFAPDRSGPDDVEAWAKAAREEVNAALDVLDHTTAWPDEETRESAAELVDRRSMLLDRTARLAQAGKGTLKTRTHGDFHLGQVLVAGTDAYIIDFEGEPARSLAERRRKTSPLRDVAGLLRSLDYAAATVALASDERLGQLAPETRDAFLREFRERAGTAFLRSYGEVAANADAPWLDGESPKSLIEFFLLEKVAYEIRYEAANRPSWLGLPVRGLLQIVEGAAIPRTAGETYV